MREWYVIRLNRPQDKSKAVLTSATADINAQLDIGTWAAAPAPRPARGAREAEQLAAQIQAGPAQAPQQKKGFGYFVKPGDRDDKSGQIAHNTREAAEAYAQELASKSPGVMYGVFDCIKIFETTTPQVITKTYNEGGELVVDMPANVTDPDAIGEGEV
jgi:hypothetical protein